MLVAKLSKANNTAARIQHYDQISSDNVEFNLSVVPQVKVSYKDNDQHKFPD